MVSLMCTLEHHRDEVNCCDFSPTLLATCSGDKTIRLYDTNDFSELPFSPLSGHGYGVHCCRFSSCGGYLVTCSTDASIMIWSSATGEVLGTLEHPGRSPVRACALAPDSTQLLSGACDGTVAVWDFSSKTLSRCIAVSEASVVACCFTPCGQMFVTGCTYGAIKLWDIHGDLLHSERDAHDLGVTCCNFAHQYKSDGCMEFRLASCGQDSLLKIWIVSQHGGTACEMTLLHTLTGQSAPVLSCAFSWDGEMVVSGSVDKTIAVYDANLGALLHTLNEHDRYVTAVALSPSMPWIATGSMDKTVKVWRTGDGDGAIVAEPRQQPTCKGRKPPGHSRLLLDDWTEEDVGTWLHEEGLEELVSIFKVNNIDGPELSQLNKDILASELGIGVTADIMKALFHSGRHVGSLETLCYTSGSQSVLEWVPLPNGPCTESVGLRGRLLRKIEALKAEQNGSEAPDEFVCPITRELMKDPVIATDGYSYEKEAIESWIKAKNRSSPMTNLPLQTTLVTPNRSLKIAIRRWKSSQQM